jgi:(p)ppGpp synthase/HD superfamily hydrolase
VSLYDRAYRFAEERFVALNIRRKYTNEPYMTHPAEVAEILRTVPHTEEMLAAALLHDTVEDTGTPIEEIYVAFGPIVTNLVSWLTDVSQPWEGNRAARKAIDREHSARAPAEAQTIKLCDLISNSRSILAYDPKFAAVYLEEKRLLLEVMTKGDPTLYSFAKSIVYDGLKQIAENGPLAPSMVTTDITQCEGETLRMLGEVVRG